MLSEMYLKAHIVRDRTLCLVINYCHIIMFLECYQYTGFISFLWCVKYLHVLFLVQNPKQVPVLIAT